MEPEVEQFYLSANDIARHFGVNVSTVHRWAYTGCPCLQMGATRERRFRIRDVEKFLRLRRRRKGGSAMMMTATTAKAQNELDQLRARVTAAEADAAEARREERAARNEAASETRTLRTVCARLAAAEKELEERRRVEAEQALAAEALTAENARLTAELSRLMAFVPEDLLIDAQPTITEKTDA